LFTVVNDNYITYCREDVEATARLYGATMAEFRRHPIDLQATKAFSPASIGKAYLQVMGIRPILERQPDFDRAALGWSMAAFFGGRAECRIRKTPLPVVYLDFLSMYPSVNALMATWRLVVAREIAIDDATEDFKQLLAEPDLLNRCFSRSFWRQLIGMVEIEPDGDVVPVRATYDQASPDFGIGINPYRTSGMAWFSMGDIVASVLLSRKMPKIRRAVRFRGIGQQTGLTPVRIRGMVEVDPSEDDFFSKGHRIAPRDCRGSRLRRRGTGTAESAPQGAGERNWIWDLSRICTTRRVGTLPSRSMPTERTPSRWRREPRRTLGAFASHP
jgi:hypothetical protein